MCFMKLENSLCQKYSAVTDIRSCLESLMIVVSASEAADDIVLTAMHLSVLEEQVSCNAELIVAIRPSG